jgi:cell division protein FtsB
MSEAEAPATPRRDRFPFLLGTAVVLVVLAVGAAGLRSWQDLATQRAREAELEAAIVRTEADVRRLEERIGRLHDDPRTLERVARHDLGMVRPGDVVFVIPEELTGRRAAPRPAAPAIAAPGPLPPRP